MKEKMKRKVSCLLAIVLILAAIFPENGLAIVRAEGEQQNTGTVNVSIQPEQTESLGAGEKHIVHVSAQSSTSEDTLLNIYLKNTDDTPDLEVTGNLADETAAGLTAEWKEDRDEAGNVTARYLQTTVPAGTSEAFDVELCYDTDEETCQKQVKVEGRAYLGDADVTAYAEEENQASVAWEKAAAAEEDDASDEEVEDSDSSLDGTTKEDSEPVKAPSKVMAMSAGADVKATVYFMGDKLNEWLNAGYTIKANVKHGDSGVGATEWSQLNMTDSGRTIGSKPVYMVEFSETEIPYGGFATLQFQAYVGSEHKEELVAFSTWTGSDVFNNKVYNGNTWQDPNFDIISCAGQDIYFMNMDPNTALADLKAQFSVAGKEAVSECISMEATEITGLYRVTVPECKGDIYDTVAFLQGETKLSEESIIDGGYDPDTKNTFYYHITKKSDGSYVNKWIEKPEGSSPIYNKTLYLDKIAFPVNNGSVIKIGNGAEATLTADSNDQNTYSYTITDGSATQQTVLTIKSDGAEYHFLWSDLNSNLLTVNEDIAVVSGTYAKTNTVYYDASLSKLSYEGTAANNVIPVAGEKIYFHAWNGDGNTESQDGEMTLLDPYSRGSNTWSDVYKAELDKEYENILFYSGNFVGDYPDSYTAAASQTVNLIIPWDKTAPCFYGDTSDDAIYVGTSKRDGYWDEAYTIRDAEIGKSNDVVDITRDTFTRKTDTLYVNSTFYDYYTDYELNGNNRDSYGGDNNMSQRNWVNFRQFDQALSDAYKTKNVSIPIYTGHFQPDWSDKNGDWGTRFSAISDTLGLYRYDKGDQRPFMSTNNSTMDINANGEKYDCAAWGLVSDTLSGGNLMTSNGEMALPHFDETFLSGNNSKNTVLGQVYHNVAFPFTKKDIGNNGVDYWYFDSAETTLAMRQDSSTNEYYLQNAGNQEWAMNVNSTSQTTGILNTYGFFPFNETATAKSAKNYNYGFGTKLEFTFRLTDDGTVQDKDNKSVPITFKFSGDDDVWVFIDGKLALDVGGAHGRVDGTLNFQTETATVSNVKASAGNATEGSNKTSKFTLDGANSDEHTLTMFYMERGMWESNMKISFNFPDENQLEVEKEVDKTDVNDLFEDVFDNQSLFAFSIKNLATHFGTKAVDSNGDEIKKQTVDLSASRCEPTSGNTCNLVDKYGSECVEWYAGLEDKTGSYRDKRYGTINLQTGIDVSRMSYLEFQYYYDYNDTPSLSNMYLQLVDASGKVKGNKTDYLSGKTYGTVTMAGKTWVTVRIDLSKLAADSGFDGTVTKIRFGYNYPRNIYLRNITFYPETVASSLTGFVTKQYAIPDYGSATSGNLEVPVGAKYSSSNGKNYVIRNDGTFVLENEETIIFRDQFRRGSYIALEELTSSELFDTTWTMYENGQAVTSMAGGDTVTNGTMSSLSGVKSTAVDDGRTEKYLTGMEEDQKIENAYKGTKPSENTFVFRSYADPNNTTGTTKLKVVFYNKVKTGSLTIKKKAAYDTDNLDGTYSFNVVFTNVGGLGLESSPITQTVKLKAGEESTIEGIPLGTHYTITEETPSDGSSLDSVDVDGPHIVNTEDGSVTGNIDSEHTSVSAVFKNTKKPVVSISLTKNWKNQDGTDLTENLPGSINIRLQRREKGDASYVEVEGYENITWTPGYDGWTYTISGLDKLKDYTQAGSKEYEYRFVELDSAGNALSEGDFMDEYKVSYGEVTQDSETGNFTASITNTLYNKTGIKIIKQDANTDDNNQVILLSGVEFKLEKLKEENGGYVVDSAFTVKTGTTSAEDSTKGQLQFDELEEGRYRLTETKAADGYSLLKDPITIVLDRQNGCTVDDELYEVDDNNTITITIKNRQKFSFPSTGGYGTTYMILGGLALAGAALFMYRLQIRKKGGRKSLKRL